MSIRHRCVGNNSFFGNFLYKNILDPKHFLVRMRDEINWKSLVNGFELAYKGGMEYGPKSYNPSLLLRYLLIPYIFNISERETENIVKHNLLAKYFVGLAVDQSPPDHSTLTVFKNRIDKLKGQNVWERIFNKILKQAKNKGIVFGSIQLIDSTHTTADVNKYKDKQRQKRGKQPRDKDAKGGVKRTVIKTVKTTKGQTVRVKIPIRIYGYKMHTSLNSKTELITSLTVTGANRYDGHQFKPLVKKDLRIIKRIKAIAADKGYDDGSNHFFCENRQIVPAISLKKTRTQKGWLKLKKKKLYKKAQKLRYKVEAKFGQAKLKHGLERCKYLGLRRYRIQAFLTSTVLNLKRMMLLTANTVNQSNLAYVRMPSG